MKWTAKLIGLMLLSGLTAVQAYEPANDEDADIVIRHSGSSASSQSLLRTVLQLCHAGGNNHVFSSDLTIGSDPTNFSDTSNRHDGEYFVVACEVEAAGTADIPVALTGVATGADYGSGNTYRMLYYKRDNGGAAMGVVPLAVNADVGYLSVVTDCPAAGANAWVDCADLPTVSYVGPSHVGTSDVEPDIFTASQNKTGSTIDWNNDGSNNNPFVSDNLIRSLSNTQVSAYLTFGVPANYRMYTALQYAQFADGHPDFADCNPAGSNYGSLAEDGDNAASEKCMPNLSKQQINSLFVRSRSADLLTELFAPAKFVGDDTPKSVWEFLPVTSTVAEPYGQDSYLGGAGAPADKAVICRGTEGTGMGAQHMLFYHNYPCDRDLFDLSVNVNLPELEAAFGFNGVRESSSAAGVSDCLLAFDDGSNTGVNAPNPNGYKMAALGVQSAARSEGADHNWRYIKIDGQAPSLKNAHAGKYEQVYAQSWQTATIATGNVLAVVDAMIVASSTPKVLASLNNAQSFGNAGWLANSGSNNCGADCVADTVLIESGPTAPMGPVYPYVRESNGNARNSCSTPRASSNSTGGIGIGD